MSATTAMRIARDDGWGRSTRFYDVDGQRLPSVTSVLGVVAKPALIPWAAKQERELVYSAVRRLLADPEVKRDNFMASLDLAVGHEKAHVKELARALTIGTECHSMIEWSMRKALLQSVGPEPRISDKALWAYMVYQDWNIQANLSVTLIEQTVYSKRYGYAGTLDWAGEIDHDGGRVTVVGDWKSGARVYPEAHLQIAAYAHALVEMGYATTLPAGCIVRLPKVETDPEPEVLVIPAEKMKDLHRVFLNVLELWKWQDSQRGK
jgi:hypothetical protein